MTRKVDRNGKTEALLTCALFVSLALAQPPVARAQVEAEDPGVSVEGCIGCHATGTAAPVSNIGHPGDLHYIDLDSRGPATESGLRQLNIEITRVDLRGTNIVVEFIARDEKGEGVPNLLDTDGTLYVARLIDGANEAEPSTIGDPTYWERTVREDWGFEGFSNEGGGSYRYTATATSSTLSENEPSRLALEIDSILYRDIPIGGGWCDFDARFDAPITECGTASLTRDIIQTDACNACHGVTSDTQLVFHTTETSRRRKDVEVCVVCHNAPNFAEDFTTMIHKIHYGSQLTQEYREGKYAHVNFTKDIGDCTTCHMQGGADEENWKNEPNMDSCGSCHDDVDFSNGTNHGSGGQQDDNSECAFCHPPQGVLLLPVATVHRGTARVAEGAHYRGPGNGFILDAVEHDRVADTITVKYSVQRDDEITRMDLQTRPEWSPSNGARLGIQLGWSTDEYTNEGSKSMPAPAQPLSKTGLGFGGDVTVLETGRYQTIFSAVSESAFDTVTVAIEGHPVQELLPDTSGYESIPVPDVHQDLNIKPRIAATPRRQVIDIDKCNACHDTAGAGLSLHGNNRSNNMAVCALCHTPDSTDIRRRPDNPAEAPDMKREESIDIKRMIHQIHMGKQLTNGIYLYGFAVPPTKGTLHDFSNVGFTGNMANCETCHLPGTYSAEDAWHTLASTVHTGDEVTDPSDDQNISPVSSVCSSCHDTDRAISHMIQNGGSFIALDENIAIAAVPEPGARALSLAALGVVVALALRNRRRYNVRPS